MFARYPTPGRTKTRLIPALGAAGAAEVARDLAERMATRLRTVAAEIEIRFTGATQEEMRTWLGDSFSFREQGDGDLGARMAHAFEDAFRENAPRVIAIGTDAPALSVRLIEEAFLRLDDHDVVIGPARDGGYYLLGLNSPAPDLFVTMPWGGDAVFAETMRRAAGVRVHQLETLDDIDRPEDLPLLDRISIIIPTLNEERHLPSTLERLNITRHDVVVADAGSADRTREIARAHGARVIEAPRGRARQMNAGADEARGRILIFLHADTLLPDNFDEHVRETLRSARLGAFALRIASPRSIYRWIERGAAARKFPYGDQALFMTRKVFDEIGGYSDLPIMEDYDLVKRAGGAVILDHEVITSPRRWERLGPIKTTLLNRAILTGRALGIPHETLARWYALRPPDS